MIRAVTVEFDFDTETEEVTNVKCNVEGQVKKARKTTKKDEVVVLEDEDLMVFNPKIAPLGICFATETLLNLPYPISLMISN